MAVSAILRRMSEGPTPQPQTAGLSVSNLSCRRGQRLLFEGLDFHIGTGEFHELRGDNGTGKTSLLRILAGLRPPDSGEVQWFTPDDEQHDHIASAIHYLGHELGLKPYLTVAQNIHFTAGILGKPLPASAVDEAGRLGLSDLLDLPVKYLSQGQKRRTALVRLLAVPRPIWLLDEPNVGLDAPSREIFAGLMRKHLDGGGLILAATHQSLGLSPDAVITLGGRA